MSITDAAGTNEAIQVDFMGYAEAAALLQAVQALATAAQGSATSAQQSAAGVQGAANDGTGARALLEKVYGLPLALPQAGNPNALAFSAASRAAPADGQNYDVIILSTNTGATSINAAGVQMNILNPGTAAPMAAGQLVAGTIVTLQRNNQFGASFLLGSRALSFPGLAQSADLSNIETALEALLGVQAALPSGGNVNSLSVGGAAPADGESFDAFIIANNTGAATLNRGGTARRITDNPGTGADVAAGALKAGTIRRFQYSAGGGVYVAGAARVPTFAATPPVAPPVGSQSSAWDQPWGEVTFPNGGHASIATLTETVTTIGSSNDVYPAAADKPSNMAVAALNGYSPTDKRQFVADSQAQSGAPFAAAGGQLDNSAAFAAKKSRWVLSCFGMNEARTTWYSWTNGGGYGALEGTVRGIAQRCKDNGAELVLNTIFHCDPRDMSQLEPNFFSDNPTYDMNYPAYKAHPVDPNLDMVPAGNDLATLPLDWTGSGILRTGSKRHWHVNNLFRRLADELGLMLLDYEWSCFRRCIETVGDKSADLNTFYTVGDPLHPRSPLYQLGVKPVLQQWARAMMDGRNDIRVFRG